MRVLTMRVLTNTIPDHVGEKIELAGWVHARRDHGKIIFIDLQDRAGIVQVVFTSKTSSASQLRSGYVIQISGIIKKRPPAMINDKLDNGHLEIEVQNDEDLLVFTESKALPISCDTSGYEVNEDVRMKYRYLDLRRPRMRENLRKRYQVIKFMRDFLHNDGFIEIETPIISKSTPEGARDYLVPSRIKKGNFYALPQSPQQYKQLLMVAGLEKYFQIARCFRDEDTRGDRQPEFTQLDIEMSFVNQEDILNLVEKLYLSLVEKLYPQKRIARLENGRIKRLTYDKAMEEYGSDKPDLREGKDKENPDVLTFAFVVDFPMFEEKDDGSLGAVHHPFTLPTFDINDDPYSYNHDRDEAALMRGALRQLKISKGEKRQGLLKKIRAFQYDFVCNGYEIGGGSIRSYDWSDDPSNPSLLQLVFEALGYNKEEVERQFGHLLEAFKYGVPPHGGIAPGIDRFIMILQNEPNIREVIAFPKSGDGYDFMMNSPSEVDPKQLKELGIEIKKSIK